MSRMPMLRMCLGALIVALREHVERQAERAARPRLALDDVYRFTYQPVRR